MSHAQLGEYSLALPACREALALSQELGDRYNEAHVLDSLGLIHRGMSEHAEAIDCYRRALAMFDELGNRLQVATAWTNLGDTHANLGQRLLRVKPFLDSNDNSIRIAAINAVRGMADGEGPVADLPVFDAIELAKKLKNK